MTDPPSGTGIWASRTGPGQPLADWKREKWPELEERQQAAVHEKRRDMTKQIILAQLVKMLAENKPMNQIKTYLSEMCQHGNQNHHHQFTFCT